MVPAGTQWIGRTFGPFRIRRLEKPGEVASVYLADDLSRGALRQVFLQVPAARAWADERLRNEFQREAARASKLKHPNLLAVIGQPLIDGRPALAFEATRGVRLQAAMHHWFSKQLGPPVGAVATIGARLLAALGHMHDLGLVHGEVGPQDVVLGREGEVWLAPFGGLALGSRRAVQARLSYLAPELVRGEDATARSDLYAVGLMMVELLAGQRIYTQSSPREVAKSILDRNRPAVSALLPFRSSALEEALETAIAHDPRNRYASMVDASRALERAMAQTGQTMDDHAVQRAVASVPAGGAEASEAAARAPREAPGAAPAPGPAASGFRLGGPRGAAPLDGAAFESNPESAGARSPTPPFGLEAIVDAPPTGSTGRRTVAWATGVALAAGAVAAVWWLG
jgi:serine/threonine-protein kinase